MRILVILGFMAVFCIAAPARGRAAEAAFATKPSVKKAGDTWVITFAAKAACDAAVSIVGPDGKVVRHLAAGVLGDNAPAPFQRGTLSQKLEWDGRDDKGDPAPAGCVVRVGLGMKAEYDKVLGWNPQQLTEVLGLGCGPDGTVYVMSGIRKPRIFAFSREGKFLRTILPPPASLPAEKIKGYRTHTLPDGSRIPIFEERMSNVLPRIMGAQRQGLTVSPDGKKVGFLGAKREAGKGLAFMDLLVLGPDGSTPNGKIYGPKIPITGRMQSRTLGRGCYLAASPDGKTVYASVGGKLYAMSWSGDGEARLFGPKALASACGVAVDARGQVYVADGKGGKILVLKPDGGEARSISVKGPDAIAVHPKTGELYVLSRANRKLVKLSPDGKELAALKGLQPGSLAGSHGTPSAGTIIALDASADPPILWVGNPITRISKKKFTEPSVLWRVVDKGNSLEAQSVATRVNEPHFVTVDRTRDEVYVRSKWMSGAGSLYPIMRYDGATGKGEVFKHEIKPRVSFRAAFKVSDFDAGPDGYLYVTGDVVTKNTAGGGRAGIIRVNRDGKIVPFAASGEHIKVEGLHHGMFGSFGIDVASNGDIYAVPGGRGKGKDAVVHRYGPDGKLKKEALVRGISDGPRCVRVGRDGSVYVSANWQPGRAEGPVYDGILKAIAKGGPLDYAKFFRPDRKRGSVTTYDFDLGMIRKLPAAGGAAAEDGKAGLWARAGLSPVPARHHAGFGQFACSCLNARFDLDGFDRIFSPDAMTCAVNVFDSAGNAIARIGRYGTLDDIRPDLGRRPRIAFLYPTHVAAGEGVLYVSDHGTNRVLRIKLGYRAEETVPVP